MTLYVYADLCSLLAATSQFSLLIGPNMQLTGCHNGNEMRNATCVETQISNELPYCSFPILCSYHILDIWPVLPYLADIFRNDTTITFKHVGKPVVFRHQWSYLEITNYNKCTIPPIPHPIQ